MFRESTTALLDRPEVDFLPDEFIEQDDPCDRLDEIADRADSFLDRLDVREAEQFLQRIRQRSAE